MKHKQINQKKDRLDKVLVFQNLAETRKKAQSLIMAGKIVVEDKRVDKAGYSVDISANIRIKGKNLKYVGRGALKLEKAIVESGVSVKKLVCMDVGASTGGFTDYLLQNGAEKVFAIDVGYGQIAWKLRQDKRVINIEKTNIRYMPFETIGEKVDIMVIDVSFISLKLVVPEVLKFLKNRSKIFALIKPQFEVGKGKIGKGGVVKDIKEIDDTIVDLSNFFKKIGLKTNSIIPSPILGAKGNQEFIAYLQTDCSTA